MEKLKNDNNSQLKAFVESLNISVEKGTIKKPVNKITVNIDGIEGDAHSGPWHRQISLLAAESIERFSNEARKKINFGEFAENITTRNIDLTKVKIGEKLLIGDVQLEITQIGKECHGDNCAIFREVGKCVMPKEGIFSKVISGGTISKGSTVSH